MEFLLFILVAEQPLSDLEFLEQGIRAGLSVIPWDRFSDTVLLKGEGSDDPWAWLVEECLTGEAMLAGREVVRGGTRGTLIRYRVGDLSVSYSNKKGPFPWSGKRLVRESRFRVYLTAFSGDSLLIWTRAVSGVRAETLDWKWRNAIRVEGLSPDVGENPGMSVAEPLLTALILGGLLYVFYSFESQ